MAIQRGAGGGGGDGSGQGTTGEEGLARMPRLGLSFWGLGLKAYVLRHAERFVSI